MNAPDKIFVEVRHPFGNEFTEMLGFESRGNSDDIEYIRKEALIEWLNDSIKEMDESRKESVAYSLLSMAGAIAISSFIEVKNKINSM